LRRLSAEQGEEAAALATQSLRLRSQPVKLGLLLRGDILVALDLVRLGGIDRDAAVDRGELAFEPHAGLAARRCARCDGGGRRVSHLGRCRRHAQNQDGQASAACAQEFRDRDSNHGVEPDPKRSFDDGSGGMVTKV
jgi:hypothetical protein